MEKILIGKIAKPYGIKGGLKINPYSDDIQRFMDLKSVYIEGENLARNINNSILSGGAVVLHFEGVNTRNQAELYRGKGLFIEKKDLIKLKEGEYFISDIIGCEIYDENNVFLGKVNNVFSHGAADVYHVSGGKRNFMIPFVKGLAKQIDIKAKKIVVTGKRFNEVVCYED